MRLLSRTPFLILFLAFFSAIRCFGSVEYTGKSLRDPFVNAHTDAPAKSGAAPGTSTAHNVQGIVFSTDKPRAIVDGAIVSVGSKLKSGEVVKSIDKNGVTILMNGELILLKQKKKGVS